MKITKVANFENEGKDIQENINQETQGQGQQDIDDISTGKQGQTHTAEVLTTISKAVGNMIESSYVGSGTVGWIMHKDGVIYEIQVSPAAHGKYFSYFQDLQSRKNTPLEESEENNIL